MSGNTVVCKPSEVTSYTAWMLCQVFHDIGLPKGVLNLVCGYGKNHKLNRKPIYLHLFYRSPKYYILVTKIFLYFRSYCWRSLSSSSRCQDYILYWKYADWKTNCVHSISNDETSEVRIQNRLISPYLVDYEFYENYFIFIRMKNLFLMNISLELGGKNAALVFEDARLDQAIPTLIRAGFVNQGEVCLCTSRIFVHEKIYDDFLEK